MLVEERLLTRPAFERAVKLSRERNESLVKTLIRERMVPEDRLLQVVAAQQGVVFVALQDVKPEAAAVASLSARFVSHYQVMPIRLSFGVLTVAVANPFDMAAVEDIESSLGLRVERVLACANDVRESIRIHYGVGAETVERILADQPEARL
jgi:type IV pilus assembly protein PilB